jgi:hypothetical protein
MPKGLQCSPLRQFWGFTYFESFYEQDRQSLDYDVAQLDTALGARNATFKPPLF